jgi:hypothetical protein
MTTAEVMKILGTEHVRQRKGVFTYWCSYYFRRGMTPDSLVEKVKQTIPNAVITNYGDHYHNFVGTAKSGSSKDSYMWVNFTIPEYLPEWAQNPRA